MSETNLDLKKMYSLLEILCLKSRLRFSIHKPKNKNRVSKGTLRFEKEKDNFDWDINVLFQELVINNSESATPY